MNDAHIPAFPLVAVFALMVLGAACPSTDVPVSDGIDASDGTSDVIDVGADTVGPPDTDADTDTDTDTDTAGPLDADSTGPQDADTAGPQDADATAPPKAEPRWVLLSREGVAPMPRGVTRLVHRASTGQMLLTGGQSVGPMPIGDAWAWSADDEVWTPLGPTPAAFRKNHGVAYDSVRDQVVLFGGLTGGLAATPEFLADTWEWDGNDWSKLSSDTAPPARAGHAMVFDAARGQTVVFGGANATSNTLTDTWLFDGAQWTLAQPATTPPARLNCQMVYDSVRERVLLFGGTGTSLGAAMNDLWAWDGNDWTELEPSDGVRPPGRGFYAMAYDSGRDRVLVHGGTTHWPPYIEPSNTFADAWEFDGERWSMVATGGLGGRSGHTAAYSEAAEAVVLFGGSDGDVLLQETWLHATCGVGKVRCVDGQVATCQSDGTWLSGSACAVGESCVHTVDAEPACLATDTCAVHNSAVAITRYDSDLLGDYRFLSQGSGPPGTMTGLQVRHGSLEQPAHEIVDPRGGGTWSPVVVASRGSELFAAVSGRIRTLSLGTGVFEPYHLVLEDVQLVSFTMTATGPDFADGEPSECLAEVQLAATIVPYFCSDIAAQPEIGETACVEGVKVVTCNTGSVNDSTGNKGAVALVEDCGAAGGSCVMQGAAASCEP